MPPSSPASFLPPAAPRAISAAASITSRACSRIGAVPRCGSIPPSSICIIARAPQAYLSIQASTSNRPPASSATISIFRTPPKSLRASPTLLWPCDTIGPSPLLEQPTTMSFHRASHLLAVILPGLCISATRAFADPADMENVTNKPALQVALRNEEFLGTSNDRQVRRVYLTLGTNQFALTVPEGYRVDASDPQKMVFSDAHDA